MYIYWDVITEPLLEILKPKSIVEIGSEDGKNTKKLLEFCCQNGGLLHIIEPYPKFNPEDWQEQYGNHFKFYRSLSLNALPLIDYMDVVLIDGDHNWYTVYNELKLIEKNTEKYQHKFPIVILHDIGWPYGRRDLYYNPENIPPAYLKPYKKKGIRPDSPELVEKGGVNAHLYNSIYENNFQNGVLTAVEDFKKETHLSLELVKLSPFYGLGILFPVELKQTSSFSEFMDKLTSSEPLISILDQIEKNRVMLEIEKKDAKLRLEETENYYKETIEAKEKELQEEVERTERLETELHTTRNRIQALEEEVEENRTKLQEKDSKIKEIELKQHETESKYQETLGAKERELQKKAKRLEELESELATVRNQVQELQSSLKGTRKNEQTVKDLSAWMEQLNKQFKALLRSRRWRVGNAIINFLYKLSFKKKAPTSVNRIHNIFSQFETWKKFQETSSISSDVIQLKQYLEELQEKMYQFLTTRRWKIGSLLGGMSSFLRGREKIPAALSKINSIFSKYDKWEPSKENKDIKKLTNWIEELQNNYFALLKTRRWELGDKIVSSVNRLLLRKNKTPKVIKDIEDVFTRYKKWKQKGLPGRAAIESESFKDSIIVSPEEAAGEVYKLHPPLR